MRRATRMQPLINWKLYLGGNFSIFFFRFLELTVKILSLDLHILHMGLFQVQIRENFIFTLFNLENFAP